MQLCGLFRPGPAERDGATVGALRWRGSAVAKVSAPVVVARVPPARDDCLAEVREVATSAGQTVGEELP